MNSDKDPIGERIGKHDISLFDTISSQSTLLDKKSFLVLHSAVRKVRRNFVYLEIGSHLGGSLQALVADPECGHIISIDPRPEQFPDERGIVSTYPKNSTARMLELLGKVPGSEIAKVKTIESDSSRIDVLEIKRPDFCFIDGEHTDEAALRDARFCLKVMQGKGVIAFHDSNVVFGAIDKFCRELDSAGLAFKAYSLADAVFVVEIGENPEVTLSPEFTAHLQDSFRAYLSALKMNEWYRAALNKPLFKFLRRIRFVRRIFIVKGFEGGQPI